ncbi:DUF397 domain-containing protein [Streptomyces sp. TR02-1]|uniref:DUF397 domain-containing protein n=1 Tax=Streptomyces sp. TR02-1 TaxID=3385977 RepID=UPI0039A2C6D7
MSSLRIAPEGSWFKSSYSGNDGTNCVEVADLTATDHHGVGIRDSKVESGPALVVGPDSFAQFVANVRGGRFDA